MSGPLKTDHKRTCIFTVGRRLWDTVKLLPHVAYPCVKVGSLGSGGRSGGGEDELLADDMSQTWVREHMSSVAAHSLGMWIARISTRQSGRESVRQEDALGARDKAVGSWRVAMAGKSRSDLSGAASAACPKTGATHRCAVHSWSRG